MRRVRLCNCRQLVQVWTRKGLYPGITIGSVYGADGAGVSGRRSLSRRIELTRVRLLGTVVASPDGNDSLLSRRVFLVPTRGWDSDPHGPESKYWRKFAAFLHPLIPPIVGSA